VLTDVDGNTISGERYQDSNRAIDARVRLMETHSDGDQVPVWVKCEFIPRVTAASEQDAKDEAREFVCMEHGIATRDVQSTNVEAVR